MYREVGVPATEALVPRLMEECKGLAQPPQATGGVASTHQAMYLCGNNMSLLNAKVCTDFPNVKLIGSNTVLLYSSMRSDAHAHARAHLQAHQ